MTRPFKTILVLDFETRWSRKPTDWAPEGYTLSNMTVEAYVRSPVFKAFGVGIHEYGSPTKGQWYRHDELPRIFGMYDWSKTAVVCQNAMFDCSILSFIYDVHPVFIFDTLSMARAIRGVEAGNSLAKLAAYFGLPPKGHATESSEGLWELPPRIERELGQYCVGTPGSDVELTEEVFARLMNGTGYPDGVVRPAYPTKELRLISMTVKMATEPKLVLDVEMLQEAMVDETAKLQNALQRAGVDESTLASNDKFAELLTTYGIAPPTKISKQTGKPAFALAKSDAHFQQLLNGDNEEVSLLCEARLRVKSTQARTRAQRFIDIAGRGTLPIPLNYAAAETLRWGGTQSINLQNMGRKSVMRKAITAPDGYAIVVGDLSQIEPRVISWLAGYEGMLDIFRAGGDPYATFGAEMFGVPGMTKDSHPLLRQSAKSAALGCFGGDTPVLTSRGYVPILRVLDTDLLWDGIEWIQHQGLLEQGEKATETARGLSATPEHRILVGGGWREWREVHTSPSLFKQALSSVSLPVSSGADGQIPEAIRNTNRGCAAVAGTRGSHPPQACSAGVPSAVLRAVTRRCAHLLGMGKEGHCLSSSGLPLGSSPASAGIHKRFTKYLSDILCSRGSAALVGGRGMLTEQTYDTGAQHAVTNAQKRKRTLLLERDMGMNQCAQMMRTETGCSHACPPSLVGAATKKMLCIQTMVAGALQCIQHGLQTVLHFLPTLSPSMVGTGQNYNWIGGTMSADTNRGTFASALEAKMGRTSGRSLHGKSLNCIGASLPLKQRMQTYDIAMAGPRNRFTILTDAGPLIVHNCSYGLGFSNFAAQLLVGFLGAPPTRYTKEDAQQLGVTGHMVEKFLDWPDNIKRMNAVPRTCTDKELFIHCLAAKAIIDKYRNAAAPVVEFWNFLTGRIAPSLIGGEEYDHKGVLLFRKEEIVLASGMSLKYKNLRQEDELGEDGKKTGKKQFVYDIGPKTEKLYGGRLANHVTQSTARIVMSDAMLRVEKRTPILSTVHDEFWVLAKEEEAEEMKDFVYREMVKTPSWLHGIPLDSDVGYAKRYYDAK